MHQQFPLPCQQQNAGCYRVRYISVSHYVVSVLSSGVARTYMIHPVKCEPVGLCMEAELLGAEFTGHWFIPQ